MQENVKGIKVLGYLVSITLRSIEIEVDSFNAKIIGLGNANPQYASEDIESLAMRQRRPVDAYRQALKAAKAYDNKINEVRHYLRPPAPGDKTLKVIVVREDYSNYLLSTRISIGNLSLNDDGEIVGDGIDPNYEDEFKMVEEGINEAYQRELITFNASSLQYRLSEIINECLPFYYDADHVFKYISYKNKDKIELIKDVVDIANKMVGIENEPRSKKGSVSVLPIPDISMSREVIAQSFQGAINDAVVSAQSVLDESIGNQGDPRKVLEAIRKTKNIIAVMNEHKGSLTTVTANAEKTIKEIRDNLRKILGGTDTKAPNRATGWKSTRKKLNMQQAYLGDALSEGENFDVISKPHMECITFIKKNNPDIKLIQSNLESTDTVTLTLSGITSNPPQLEDIGFFDGVTGISYNSSYDASELDIVARWWDSL